jgi:hypothetical protein
MANRSRNARFFRPHGIGLFSNPIGRASHQVLWRRFTHCLKLKNTNRHLLASTSFKALHLGYVYVSTAFCLIRIHPKMLHWHLLYVSTACPVIDLHSIVLYRGLLWVLTVYSSMELHSIHYIEETYTSQQRFSRSGCIQIWCNGWHIEYVCSMTHI